MELMIVIFSGIISVLCLLWALVYKLNRDAHLRKQIEVARKEFEKAKEELKEQNWQERRRRMKAQEAQILRSRSQAIDEMSQLRASNLQKTHRRNQWRRFIKRACPSD